jgi:hypothetical protein
MCYMNCKYEYTNGECMFVEKFPPDAQCVREFESDK